MNLFIGIHLPSGTPADFLISEKLLELVKSETQGLVQGKTDAWQMSCADRAASNAHTGSQMTLQAHAIS